jgi:hypothetical protein
MTWLKKHIAILLLCAACTCVGISIAGMFVKKQRPINQIEAISKAYQEAIKAKDETIGLHRELINEKDDRIAEHQKTDSILLARINTNQPKYKANDKKLQDVSAAVDNLDKQQLRREYANY